MRKFKKISSLLSLLLVFSIVAITVPFQALAQENRQDSADSFIIEEYVNGSWQFVASSPFPGQPYPKNRYTSKSFTLPESSDRVRIIHNGGTQSAHLDQVILNGHAPNLVQDLYRNNQLPTKKLATADYDVINAQNRTIEFSWDTKGSSLDITGVAEDFKDTPYRWPNQGYLAYTIGDTEAYTFSEVPASSHPFSTRYAYFSADKKNLIVKIDWTSDNTLDIDKNGDWVELGVVTNDGLKTFLINGYKTKWGTSDFTYTDKVSWQHKVYTFLIPLSQIGVDYNQNIQFRIRYYGTDSGSNTDNSNDFGYEFQIPNSSVLSDFAQYGGPVGARVSSPINKNFPNPPSFSAGANNNWSTSLSEKVFSIVANDTTDFGLNGTINYIGCASNSISFVSPNLFNSPDCYPIFQSFTITNQNTSLSNPGNYDYPLVTITSDLRPLRLPVTLKEVTNTTSVEPVNDPNKVRVTISGNATLEEYKMRYSIGGEVVYSRPDGGFGVIPPYYSIQGRTFISIGGITYVIEPSTSIGEITPLVSVSSPLTGSREITRNSNIVSVTQPKCTQYSTGSWWRGDTQHNDCIAYGLSADGRTGTGYYWSSWDTGGGFREFAGVVAVVVLTVVGMNYGILSPAALTATPEGVTSVLVVGSSEFTSAALVSAGVNIGSSAITSTLTSATAVAVAASLQAATDGSYGTVEQSISSSAPLGTEGQWTWVWSELPLPPTVTCNPPQTMNSSGVCAVPVTCPNGANNPPICSICTSPQTMNSSGVCAGPVTTPPVGTLSSLPQSVIVTVCSGNTPTWNGSSCVGIPPVVPPVIPPGGTPLGGTPPGGTPSGGGTPSDGNLNGQSGGSQNNQGGQNQGGQGNQGSSSATISAEPNRVRSGDTSTISWTLNNVSNCAITKNGTLWKSDISSSGSSNPPEIITAQTTYTITCPSVSPESVTVNILPIFQEF